MILAGSVATTRPLQSRVLPQLPYLRLANHLAFSGAAMTRPPLPLLVMPSLQLLSSKPTNDLHVTRFLSNYIGVGHPFWRFVQLHALFGDTIYIYMDALLFDLWSTGNIYRPQ